MCPGGEDHKRCPVRLSLLSLRNTDAFSGHVDE